MSDFISNLVARSFTDVPVIQPRVSSLFEPAVAELVEEPQSPMQAIGPTETEGPRGVPTIANASDTLVEEHRLKPNVPLHEDVAVTAELLRPRTRRVIVRKLKPETNEIVVPAGSFRDGKNEAGDKQWMSQRFSEPRLVRSRHGKDLLPVERQHSTSAPIIRVTVGRVEVRAVHPPMATPKPEKPAAPKVSLEDYLQKRERGTR
jgi:hypothetical protein